MIGGTAVGVVKKTKEEGSVVERMMGRRGTVALLRKEKEARETTTEEKVREKERTAMEIKVEKDMAEAKAKAIQTGKEAKDKLEKEKEMGNLMETVIGVESTATKPTVAETRTSTLRRKDWEDKRQEHRAKRIQFRIHVRNG